MTPVRVPDGDAHIGTAVSQAPDDLTPEEARASEHGNGAVGPVQAASETG
jgi:hypothetical protein